MILFVIGFLMGDVWLQSFAKLPSTNLLILLIISTVICCWILPKIYRAFLLGFCCGMLFTTLYAHNILRWQLPDFLEGVALQAEGAIASIPVIQTNQISFLFQIDTIVKDGQRFKLSKLARLTWRAPYPTLVPGQIGSLTIRVKRIHGNQSFGVFDFEQWALQKNLRLQGYVVNTKFSSSHGTNRISNFSKHWRYGLQWYRYQVLTSIKNLLPQSNTAHWLPALIVGERQNIPAEQWEILRLTGTNHLMAIAGLHIGMLALFCYKLISFFLRKYHHLFLLKPLNEISAIIIFLIAFLYSALAGFSVPTQRACYMLGIVTAAILLRIKIHAWRVWSTALLGVLVLNPLVVLSESFWLSFGTIAIIIFGMRGRLKPRGWWWNYGRMQWLIGIGLIPLTLIFFQQIAWTSFIANSIAIPWLSFFILPFCLLSLLALPLSKSLTILLLNIADQSLSVLWKILTWLAQLPLAKLQFPGFTWYQYGFLLLGIIIFLLPLDWKRRVLCLFFILPLFFIQPEKPNLGAYWVTMLDVGQGLSVIIQTKNHLIIYDTGPKYYEGSDMGERVVLPFLVNLGYPVIDLMILSHGDNDHIGGYRSIKKTWPIYHIYSSVPAKLGDEVVLCTAGYQWQWDQVNFTFLHPDADFLQLGNDSSCVLQIDNGKVKTLIAGDIEKRAEKFLLQKGMLSKIDLLIAPHHGSKTSAVKDFVRILHPTYVLYGTGYRNQYHFPHPQVIAAYRDIQAQQFSTAKSGALRFKFEDYSQPPLEYRIANRRYWHTEMIDIKH